MSGLGCCFWWFLFGALLGWLASWLLGRMLGKGTTEVVTAAATFRCERPTGSITRQRALPAT